LLKELAAGKSDGEILAWVLEKLPRRRADRGALCSDDAKFTTGTSLKVDGGWLAQ
jgi:hypothetical protein